MKDIRIYDFEFNLLCIMTDVISCQWHILYNDIGTFEGRFSLNDEISKIILEHKYIVIVEGEHQAICTGKMVSNELVVCGRTVNWILSKRVRPPFSSAEIDSGNLISAQRVLLYCLDKGFINPPTIEIDGTENSNTIDNSKKVTNFEIPQLENEEAMTSHFWRTSAHDIATLSTELCEKMNRGYKVVFDIVNEKWVFEFIIPTERNIFISEASRTCYETEYTEDYLSYTDGGWYTSDSDVNDEDVGNWYYLKNSENTGIYYWESVLGTSGKSEAQDTLQKRQIIEKIDTKFRNLKYGTDYSIGDIFNVYLEFGSFSKLEKFQVTGVNIVISSSSCYEEPILKQIREE